MCWWGGGWSWISFTRNFFFVEFSSSTREKKIDVLGWFGDQATLDYAATIEEGRVVARDIGGSDPERMAPPRVEEYVREVFKGSNISVKVGEYMYDGHPLSSWWGNFFSYISMF